MVDKGMSDQALAELVEYGEAEAFADMYLAATHLGWRVERVGAAVALIAPQVPIFLFNRVMGLGIHQHMTKTVVDDLIDLYRQAGAKTFGFAVAPTVLSDTVATWLASRGLSMRDNWPKVYRMPDTTIDVPTDLRIERIGPDHALAYAETACAAFGMPPTIIPWLVSLVDRPRWQHYLAFDGEVPVATGSLFVRDGIGWLGIGSTLPSHRRRGAQGAVMARRIRDAAALGCRWVITETGEDLPTRPNPSYHNMVRTGFKVAYLRPNYVFQ